MGEQQRARLARLIHSNAFSNAVIFLIVVNSITLGLETNTGMLAAYEGLLHLTDHVIVGVFVIELALRLYVFRGHFFRSGWNIFDFVIIALSVIPNVGPFSVLRTFRIFRTLRLISTVPSIRTVVTALIKSIPGITAVLSILFIIFYVAAVMATQTFGTVTDPKMHALFGTILNSMYTLFQLMTMDNFTDDILVPTLGYYPHATVFFVGFIVVTTFSVLNLFIGIIVDALNGLHDVERERLHEDDVRTMQEIRQGIARLEEQISKMKTQ